MSSPAIRGFAEADFDAWYPLWRGYQSFYEVDLAPETSRVTWQRLLDPGEPMHGAFALDGTRIVGFVHYIEHRSCWTVENYCYLQDLFVAPETRGGGHGRRLIEHVYAEAARLGCGRVWWLTRESNATARQLYDQIADSTGFVQYRKLL